MLRLTLKAGPFQATLAGDKAIEVRRDSQWIRSRLMSSATLEPRSYDVILYYHAPIFDPHAPVCAVAYAGWLWWAEPITLGPYPNGFRCSFPGPVFVICHGRVLYP